MPRVFIDGEAGTTGLDIKARLAATNYDILSLDPTLRKNLPARLEVMREADLVILCLPDGAAQEVAKAFGLSCPFKVLDASSAHRTAPGWTYGFPEMSHDQPAQIAQARRVSNPGCYPTGAIALLRPLILAGLLPPDYPLTINAVSGYSGGGHVAISAHEAAHGPAFELYSLGLSHKHVAEIATYSGLQSRPVFVPSVGHFARGMIVSIPLHLALLRDITVRDLKSCLETFYKGQRHVQVVADSPSRLDAAALAGQDILELRVHGEVKHGHALLTARLDNLGKGAAGAALQNAMLMLGQA